jgi:hypothetical protein
MGTSKKSPAIPAAGLKWQVSKSYFPKLAKPESGISNNEFNPLRGEPRSSKIEAR